MAIRDSLAFLHRGGAQVATSRLVAVDATRGLALLAMMSVHALYVVGVDGEPTVPHSLFAGRSAATFAVLAGVGIAFMTRRVQVSTRRDGVVAASSLTARALAIGSIGLALGYTQARYGAVILPYYAALFLLAIPLIFLRNRALIATACAIAVVVPALSHLARNLLPAPQLVNPGFGYLLRDPGGLLIELTLTGYYPALPWMAYICVGLAVGRLTLSSARVAGGLLGGGLAVAVAASSVSWLLTEMLGGEGRIEASSASAMGSGRVAEILAFGPPGTTPTSTWWWLAIDAPHSSTPPDLLHTAGSAVALLGGMLLLTHAAPPVFAVAFRRALTPLAAAGAMPLTLYTAHIVFMNSPLDVFGAVAGYLVQVTAALLFALAWSKAVGRGPLETLVGGLAQRARRVVTAVSTAR